jgi:hypothetical protein
MQVELSERAKVGLSMVIAVTICMIMLVAAFYGS